MDRLNDHCSLDVFRKIPFASLEKAVTFVASSLFTLPMCAK